MKKSVIGSALLLLLPGVAFAQIGLQPAVQFLNSISVLEDLLVPILIAAAVLVFFYGLIMYLWGGSKEDGHKKGRGIMVWGLIALFVMVSVWGIIKIAQDAFGINGNQTVPIPAVPVTGGAGF